VAAAWGRQCPVYCTAKPSDSHFKPSQCSSSRSFRAPRPLLGHVTHMAPRLFRHRTRAWPRSLRKCTMNEGGFAQQCTSYSRKARALASEQRSDARGAPKPRHPPPLGQVLWRLLQPSPPPKRVESVGRRTARAESAALGQRQARSDTLRNSRTRTRQARLDTCNDTHTQTHTETHTDKRTKIHSSIFLSHLVDVLQQHLPPHPPIRTIASLLAASAVPQATPDE
jgi:hypothetical protein